MSLDRRERGSLATQLMQMLPSGQPGIRVMAERLELAIPMPCIPLPCLWLRPIAWPVSVPGGRLVNSWK